jgi:hypothetical protein
MRCPGSVVLEEGLPDQGSFYADEGSAAHQLATYCLEDSTEAAEYIGEEIRIGERRFVVDKTMAGYVQDYVDYVRELAKGKTLLVERDVPIGHLTGEAGATGRSDAIIMDGSTITVVDLKYGMGVSVEAEENEQAQMYALGALEEYGIAADFTHAEMHIHMPRKGHVSSWRVSVEDLNLFSDRVRQASLLVDDIKQGFAVTGLPRYMDEPLDVRTEALQPSEKACQWCKAKATCPALAAEVAELVSDVVSAADFADLVPAKIDAETGDNHLTHAMSKVGLVEDWCKAIRAEIERRLFAGLPVEGYKLVEGKQGNRAWTDPVEAEKLLKSFRLREAEMYDMKVISPTTAEKVLKASPKRWEKAQSLITRAPGKPSVAPASDKRPALAIVATAEDFRGLIDG